MKVEIHIPQSMQHKVEGKKVVNIELEGNNKTIGDCIEKLLEIYPGLKDELFKGDKLRDHIEIYLNMQSTYPEEFLKKVKDGDKIHIITMLAGG